MESLAKSFAVISAIGVNTFRQAIRSKVLGSLLLAAIAIIGVSLLLGQMSLHEEVRIARDFSLAGSLLFSVIIAVYASVTLLDTEFERRTIYTLLSKPIYRWQFLLGKYVGILALLVVVVTVLMAISSGVVALQGGDLTQTYAIAFVTLFLQLAIMTAVTILFSTVASPLLSGLCSAAVFVIGNLASQLEAMKEMLEAQHNPFAFILDILEYVVPNLESLNLSTQATYSIPIPPTYLGAATWYAASYAAVCLLLAAFLFARRDFS